MNLILTNAEIRELVEAGAKAPSGGNVQAWLVDAYKNGLELSVDPARSTLLDAGRLASFLSLGCFLENVLILSEKKGLFFQVKLVDRKQLINPVIQLLLNRKSTTKKSGQNLANYINKRLTNRKMYDGEIISKNLIDELRKSIHQRSISVTNKSKLTLYLESNENKKKNLAEILGKVDRIQNMNDVLFRQLLKELRFSQKEIKETRDGIDVNTMEFPGNVVRMIQLMRSHPNVRKIIPKTAFERQSRPLLRGCSHLGCLTTNWPINRETMIDAGQGLERLWLTATRLNLAFHPWTVLTFFLIRVHKLKGKGFNSQEITELKQLEVQFKKLFNIRPHDTPILIFRLSKAKPPSALALRRFYTDFTRVKDELL